MKRGVVLFGHGSRDPAWRRSMDAVAQVIRSRAADVPVVCAFLELTQPDLPAAVAELAASGAQAVRVVPLFLGVGTHARQDLPKLVAAARERCAGVAVEIAPPVGEEPEVIQLLAELALREQA